MPTKETIEEAYQKLFLDEVGALKPHARVVLEDLMAFTCFFSDTSLQSRAASPSESLILVEGSRSVVRRLLRMSGAGDQMLKRLLEGAEHG